MYIIFGTNAAEEVSKTALVLEVDTIRLMPLNVLAPSYCVLDGGSLSELGTVFDYKKVHDALIEQYRAKNWTYCINAVNDLRGRWNGELDEFYDSLLKRAQHYLDNPPGENWDYAVEKHVTPE